MTLQTFDFSYHIVGDKYPPSSYVVQFGRGYSFATAPRGPDQLTFQLSFEAMFWWYNETGVLDRGVVPVLNVARLQDFYESVLMYTTFNYPHPSRGTQVCRFNKPLPPFKSLKDKVIRDGDSNARGHQVEPFLLELIQQP